MAEPDPTVFDVIDMKRLARETLKALAAADDDHSQRSLDVIRHILGCLPVTYWDEERCHDVTYGQPLPREIHAKSHGWLVVCQYPPPDGYQVQVARILPEIRWQDYFTTSPDGP